MDDFCFDGKLKTSVQSKNGLKIDLSGLNKSQDVPEVIIKEGIVGKEGESSTDIKDRINLGSVEFGLKENRNLANTESESIAVQLDINLADLQIGKENNDKENSDKNKDKKQDDKQVKVVSTANTANNNNTGDNNSSNKMNPKIQE